MRPFVFGEKVRNLRDLSNAGDEGRITMSHCIPAWARAVALLVCFEGVALANPPDPPTYVFTIFDHPLGVNGSVVTDISANGKELVGYYYTNPSYPDAFYYSSGTYLTIKPPSAFYATAM